MAITNKNSTYSVIKESVYGSAETGSEISITSISGAGTSTCTIACSAQPAVGTVVYIYKPSNPGIKYTVSVVSVNAGTSIVVNDSASVLSTADVSSVWKMKATLFVASTSDQFVDTTDFGITPAVAEIKRNVSRNSFVSLESLLGEKTSSGNVTIEVTPSETAGVNGEDLFENALGSKITAAVSGTTISSASSTSSFVVASATNLNKGQVIQVGSEFTTIQSLTGTTVVVRPALSVQPTASTAVTPLTTFKISSTSDAQSTLSFREHIGNQDDFIYSGCVVNTMTLTIPVANIPTAQFAVSGAGFASGTNKVSDTLPSRTQIPFVGKNAVFTVGGKAYCAKDIVITVGNQVYDSKGLCSEGISNKLVTSKDNIQAKFTIDYTDTANFNAFQKGDKGELWLHLYNQDGKQFAVYAPNCKRVNVTKGKDGHVYTEEVVVQLMSSGTVGVDYEDALIIGIQ